MTEHERVGDFVPASCDTGFHNPCEPGRYGRQMFSVVEGTSHGLETRVTGGRDGADEVDDVGGAAGGAQQKVPA